MQNHLVMSHLAQRRDIHDDKLIREFATLVGTTETLKRLYVLTYADMRATGPKVWNNWKDMLLGEAYLRVADAFARTKSEHGANATAAYFGNPSAHHYGMTTHAPHFLGPRDHDAEVQPLMRNMRRC